MKIQLTSEQWAAFGRDRMDDEYSPLGPCCGNISNLRDAILDISENGGEATGRMLEDLKEKWGWCRDGHVFDDERHQPYKILRSLIEQAGSEW